MSTNLKKFGKATSWFLGIICILFGFVEMFSHLSAFFILLAGLFVLPPMNRWLSRNFKKEAGFGVGSWKAVVVFIIFATLFTITSPQTQENVEPVDTNQSQAASQEREIEVVTESYSVEELKKINRQMRLDRDGAKFLEEEREAEEARKKAEEELKKFEEEKKAEEARIAEEKRIEEEKKAEEEAAQKAAEEAAKQQSQTTYSQPTPAPNYSNPTPAPQPSPQPESTPAPNNNCHPSYPTYCIPIGSPDLNCPDINASKIVVYQPDPHGLDRDKDGIGCENN